jgi:hypothetical protein
MAFGLSSDPRGTLASGGDHINDAFDPEKTAAGSPQAVPAFRLRWGRITTVRTRLIGFRRAVATCGLAGVLGVALPMPHAAQAQAKLNARYVVTLGGLPIGRGAWIIDINNDEYTAVANGRTTGLLSVISNGEGTTAARGHVVRGNLVPSTYVSTMMSDRTAEEMRVTLAGGNVKESVIEPEPPPHPDRIPVTEAHRKNVTDPMSGSLARVAGTGDVLSPEACNRKLSLFDGRLRYDLKLAYKRMDTVKADKGYAGPAAVCAIYFVPIAGYIPDRKAIKYLIAQRDMEVWLVPIAGTRFVVPYRLSIPTPLGLGVLEATQFVATPQPTRASAVTHP